MLTIHSLGLSKESGKGLRREEAGQHRGGGIPGQSDKEEGMRGGKGSERRGVSGARVLRGSVDQLTCSH